MSLMSTISDIQPIFDSILEYTQGYQIVSDDVFLKWATRKEKLYKLFDNQLIKNFGYMEFHLSEKEKEQKYEHFCNAAMVHLGDPLESNPFYNFLTANKATFFDNVVSNDNFNIPDLKLGMKLVRAFKFFITDKVRLARVQELASTFIQQNKIAGELCFSIHPLDFLTASVNTYKWRSCHALDGEYRAGNLSYMADEVTFMCYIQGSDTLTYPKLPRKVKWNSKKWRMYAYLDPTGHLCMQGRQYPYSLSGIDEYLFSVLPKGGGMWWPFAEPISGIDHPKTHEIIPLTQDYCAIADRFDTARLVPLRNIVTDTVPYGALHFNDVLNSSSYSPLYTSRPNRLTSFDKEVISMGSEVMCMHCGEYAIDSESGLMLCDSCRNELGFNMDEEEEC